MINRWDSFKILSQFQSVGESAQYFQQTDFIANDEKLSTALK
jgi:hypothetical protein